MGERSASGKPELSIGQFCDCLMIQLVNTNVLCGS